MSKRVLAIEGWETPYELGIAHGYDLRRTTTAGNPFAWGTRDHEDYNRGFDASRRDRMRGAAMRQGGAAVAVELNRANV